MPVSHPQGRAMSAFLGVRGHGIRLDVILLRVVLTGLAVAGIVLEHGFYERPLPAGVIMAAQVALLAAYWLDVFLRARRGRPPIPGQGPDWLDRSLPAIFVAGLVLRTIESGAWLAAEAAVVLVFLIELWRLNIALSRTLPSPAILLPASFLFLIGAGTLLIKAPVAVPPGQELSWLDAAFTMTSAVCVTGLVVRDTATEFTPLGQTIIAIFIQLGGLGLVIFGSTIALLVGQSLSFSGQRSLSETLGNEPVHRLAGFTRFIVLSALGIELIGAALMYPLWEAPPGETLSPARRAGLSLFHSVSAFCNAGFDLTGESLVPYRRSLLAHGVVMPLVVLGALGFPVLNNLAAAARERFRRWRSRGGPYDAVRGRLTLHTKIVLVTTLALYIVGLLSIAAGELAAPRPEFPADTPPSFAEAALDAHFTAIAGRTAGFTIVPMERVDTAGRFTITVLMFIGGSPGGTAGGVKTTVLAVLVLSVVATIRQRPETEAFGRTISDAIVRRAATIAICFVMMVTLATLLLTLTERAPLETVLFEAVSAATTTGLSMGVTPELSPAGKSVVIAAMFLGRIGPLALAGALVFRRVAHRPYAYAHEGVGLG